MAVHWAGRPFHITWDGGVSLVTGGSCPDRYPQRLVMMATQEDACMSKR
jgi:hypothetical protein